MDEIKAGDLVLWRGICGGWLKAKVISVRNVEWIGGVISRYATIRITSRWNRIFYCGYTFETSRTFIVKRKPLTK